MRTAQGAYTSAARFSLTRLATEDGRRSAPPVARFMAVMLVFGSSAFLSHYAPFRLRRSTIRRIALVASLIALATACLRMMER